MLHAVGRGKTQSSLLKYGVLPPIDTEYLGTGILTQTKRTFTNFLYFSTAFFIFMVSVTTRRFFANKDKF